LLDILGVNEAVVYRVQAGDSRILREVLGAPELLLEGLSLTVKFYLHSKEDGKLEFEVKWEPGIGLLKVQGTSFLRRKSPQKSVIVW
jgi:hypothetical protein